MWPRREREEAAVIAELAHGKQERHLTCCGATSLECQSELGHSSLRNLGQVTAPLWVVCPSTMPLRARLGLLFSYSFMMPTRKAHLITQHYARIMCCAVTGCSVLYLGLLEGWLSVSYCHNNAA